MADYAITIEDVQRAADDDRRAGPAHAARARPAPVQLTGATVFVKHENMQPTGSFKERGAVTKLESLDAGGAPARRHRHVGRQPCPGGRLSRAAPRHPGDHRHAGGHAPGEGGEHALLRRQGHPVRRDALRSRRPAPARSPTREGLVFVHPYDDPKVMAGQGTIALEMLGRRARSRPDRRAHRRRRADLRHRGRRQGAQARHRDHRRRGRPLSLLPQRHPRRGPADRRRDARRGHRGQDRRAAAAAHRARSRLRHHPRSRSR